MPLPEPLPSEVSSCSACKASSDPSLDLDFLLILAAHHGERDLVPHLMLAQGDDQAVGGGDGLAVDRRHDVAGLNARPAAGPSLCT